MTFDTSKIDEWTVEMCRDWLFINAVGKDGPAILELLLKNGEHPIPQTLCEASKLPEGWAISEIKPYNHMMYAGAVKSGAFPSAPRTYAHAYGTNELHARFILRCKVESRPH